MAASLQSTEVRFASFLSGEFITVHSSKSTGKETGKTHLCAEGEQEILNSCHNILPLKKCSINLNLQGFVKYGKHFSFQNIGLVNLFPHQKPVKPHLYLQTNLCLLKMYLNLHLHLNLNLHVQQSFTLSTLGKF